MKKQKEKIDVKKIKNVSRIANDIIGFITDKVEEQNFSLKDIPVLKNKFSDLIFEIKTKRINNG